MQVLKCATFDLAIQAFYLDFWYVSQQQQEQQQQEQQQQEQQQQQQLLNL